MDIQKKLQYYRTVEQGKQNTETTGIPVAVRALRDHFDGEIVNPSAPYLKLSRRYPLPAAYARLLNVDFLSRNQLSGSFRPEGCLFFDLETTGLSGGVGTFAFLIGFLYISDDMVITDQYFLPDFGREYHLFNVLKEFMARFDILVSYNGKSYDLPLLRNRFLLNRVNPQLNSKSHLDLLHLVRRIWSKSFSACDLQTIEVKLNLAERHNDIPGAFIPQAYFDFINTGTIHNIIRLIEHNHVDLQSLLGLLQILHALNDAPDAALLDGPALQSLARLAYEMQNERYLDQLENLAHTNGRTDRDVVQAWRSLVFKKNKHWSAAVDIWKELLNSPVYNLMACEELAKYHEHISKNVEEALSYTNRAIHTCEVIAELLEHAPHTSSINLFLHRRERLIKKVNLHRK